MKSNILLSQDKFWHSKKLTKKWRKEEDWSSKARKKKMLKDNKKKTQNPPPHSIINQNKDNRNKTSKYLISTLIRSSNSTESWEKKRKDEEPKKGKCSSWKKNRLKLNYRGPWKKRKHNRHISKSNSPKNQRYPLLPRPVNRKSRKYVIWASQRMILT